MTFLLVQLLTPDLVWITYHILIIVSSVILKVDVTDYYDCIQIYCIAAFLTGYLLEHQGLHSLKSSSNSKKSTLRGTLELHHSILIVNLG